MHTTATYRSHDLRTERILAHTGLAKGIALRLAGRVPKSVDMDDLVAAGMLGLIDAADRYDESRGIPFEAYSRRRIQGAILDLLRAEDHLTRRERRSGREADRSEERMRAKLRRELTAEEVHAARGGVPRTLPHSQTFVPVEDVDDGSLDTSLDAFARLATAQDVGRLRDAIATLPERERQILALYYEEELTYREIGSILGVSESRICQILRAVQRKLRERLEAAEESAT
ncbi:MAG: sigma-70 family RNA polymerase sigma factor [Myxococcales bacterium]